ncbi:hypothetical protein M8818_001655 [Zalaria obscura]|uniref:Uncharacterized protein n=1 Tax=Zalaria obscura TaxID=2024903 RepID=A0ACC3SJJ2_9PEZI
MLVRLLTAAAVAASSVSAFRDTSPFFLFSTAEFEGQSQQIATARDVQARIEDLAKSCPSDSYIVVSQPGVSAADFAGRQTTPHLRRRLGGEDKTVKSSVQVRDVVGQVSGSEAATLLSKSCGSLVELDGSEALIPLDQETPQVVLVTFPALPEEVEKRVSMLRKQDSYLNTLLSSLPNDKFTVIYTTTPYTGKASSEPQHPDSYYHMDEPYPSDMHIDLKRDLSVYPRATNGTNPDSNLPLFEKYQFLSSGIFMGLGVSILLISILYIGISAIAGLEVSYMAFSKEMGPAAQKKQQQQ